MSTAVALPESVPGACRIEYETAARCGPEPLAVLPHPRPAWAYASAVELHPALEGPVSRPIGERAVTCVFLPSGAATPFAVQKRATDWMGSRPGEDGAPIDILYRSERLLWRPGRAVLFGSVEACAEILPAIAHFSYCEACLRDIEREVAEVWPILEADIHLTHGVSSRDLKRQAHVDAMTRDASVRRMLFVRLQTAFDMPPGELAGPARRIFAELALQASAVERLKSLDDMIEIAEDLYELANDRLSEFRYFIREYRIEILIVVVLLAELLVTWYGLIY